MGKHKVKVLCDVLQILAGGILLCRHSQFDRKVMDDGYLNRYSFIKDGRKTPFEFCNVFVYQLKLEKKKRVQGILFSFKH